MRADGTNVGLAVIEDGFTFVSEIGFFGDLGVKIAQIVFSETSIFEEASHFVVNVLCELGLVAILEFEFADKHALELFTLLNIHQTFTTRFTHA